MTFIEAAQSLTRKLTNIAEKREKLNKVIESVATKQVRRDAIQVCLPSNGSFHLKFEFSSNSRLAEEMINELALQMENLDNEEKRLRGELLDLCDREQ